MVSVKMVNRELFLFTRKRSNFPLSNRENVPFLHRSTGLCVQIPALQLLPFVFKQNRYIYIYIYISGADPGFFLGGGALVSCSTSTPINHIVFFFCRITVVLENRRSSQEEGGWGAHPLHPPPRSAPVYCK